MSDKDYYYSEGLRAGHNMNAERIATLTRKVEELERENAELQQTLKDRDTWNDKKTWEYHANVQQARAEGARSAFEMRAIDEYGASNTEMVRAAVEQEMTAWRKRRKRT